MTQMQHHQTYQRQTYQRIVKSPLSLGVRSLVWLMVLCVISLTTFAQAQNISSQTDEHTRIVTKSYPTSSIIQNEDLEYLNDKIVFSASEQAWIDAHPVITYGAGINWYPFEYLDDFGNYKGLSKDYLDIISQVTGMQIKPVSLAWDEMVEKTKSGDIDLLASIAKNQERQKVFNFADAHTQATFYLFVTDQFQQTDTSLSESSESDHQTKSVNRTAISSNSNIHSQTNPSTEDMAGKTIALVKGYALNANIKKDFRKATFVEVMDWEDGYKLVKNGQADAFVEVFGTVRHYLNAHHIDNIVPYKPHQIAYKFEHHIATSKQNTELLNIINRVLRNISDDDKQAIYSKWATGLVSHDENPTVDDSFTHIQFTIEEQEWLNQHPVIRFAGGKDWRPNEYFDEFGVFQGINADILRYLDTLLPSEFEYIPIDSYTETLEQIDSGYIDFIPSPLVWGDVTSYDLTSPVLSSPIVITMQSENDFVDSLSQLSHKKVASLGMLMDMLDLEVAYPELEFYRVDSVEEGLLGVSGGEYDAFINGVHGTIHLINDLHIENIRIVGKTQYRVNINFAVDKDNEVLLSILNKAIDRLDTTTKNNILARWGHKQIITKSNFTLIYIILASMGSLILLGWFWNRSLKHQIDLRNDEIEKRKYSEVKLLKAHKRLEVANITAGLSAWELIFPDRQTIEKIENSSYSEEEVTKKLYEQVMILDEKIINPRIKNHPDSILFSFHDWTQFVLDKQRVIDVIENVRKTKGRDEIELTVIGNTEKYADVEEAMRIIYSHLIYEETDGTGKVIGTKLDITEIKRTQRELYLAKQKAEEANRAKSDFVATISHEIRTPLNVILGYTELLNERVKNLEYQRVLKTIHSAGKDLLILINDILDMSKIEAGKLDIHKVSSDLRGLITDVSQIFRLKLQEKNLDFVLNIDDRLPSTLFIDEVRVRQILVNLLGNAIKFTEAGQISVSAWVINDEANHESSHELKNTATDVAIDTTHQTLDVVIEVTDTGIGMSEEVLERIFGKFEQASSAINRQYGGAGLGLAICQQLANMMGGNLTASSQLGSGSSFRVTLQELQVGSTQPIAETVSEPYNDDVSSDWHASDHTLISNPTTNISRKTSDIVHVSALTEFDKEPSFFEEGIFEEAVTSSVYTTQIGADMPVIVTNNSPTDTGLNLIELSDIEEESDLIQSQASTPQGTLNSLTDSSFNDNSLNEVIIGVMELQPMCEQLLLTNDLNGVSNMIRQLKQILKQYPNAMTQAYVDNLANQLDVINLLGVRKALNEFEELIVRLHQSNVY